MSTVEFIAILTAAVGAVASAVVSVLNRRQLKVVHEDTNGTLSALKAELAALRPLKRKYGRPRKEVVDASVQLAGPEGAGVRGPYVGKER